METTNRREGWLVKAPLSAGSKHASLMGGFSAKRSRKRYFILDGSQLQYFEKPGMAKAKGELELGKNSVVQILDNKTNLVVIPFPGSKKELMVSANDQKEAREWYEALLKAIEGGDAAKVKAENTVAGEEEEEKGDETESELSESESEESNDEHSEITSCSSPRASSSSKSHGRESKVQGVDQTNLAFHVKRKTHIPKLEYETIMEGCVEKEGGGFSLLESSWTKQYAVLNVSLQLFESESASRNPKQDSFVNYPLEAVFALILDGHDGKLFRVCSVGSCFTLRCSTSELASEWVEKLNNCNNLLRIKTPPVKKMVDKSAKIVPDFLKELEKNKSSEQPLAHPAIPPSAEEVFEYESDEDTIEPPPTYEEEVDVEAGIDVSAEPKPQSEDRFAKLRALRSGSKGESSQESHLSNTDLETQETNPQEDRFAKLRALRAKRESTDSVQTENVAEE